MREPAILSHPYPKKPDSPPSCTANRNYPDRIGQISKHTRKCHELSHFIFRGNLRWTPYSVRVLTSIKAVPRLHLCSHKSKLMAVRCFDGIPSPVLIVAPAMFKRPPLFFNSSSRQCLVQLRRPLQPPAVQFVYQPMSSHARLTAADESGVELVPRSVPVRVAHELLQAGHRYLDVRTVDEFSTGHPVGATNIPYMFKAGSGMTKNREFLKQVSSVFREDDEIIIGCQSGRWSLMAATILTSSGFTGVTDIAGGYLAWVQNRLPLDQ